MSAALHEPRPLAQRPLRIGLVNNMPDTALEATERQFGSLLRASGVCAEMIGFALPGVVRGEASMRHLAEAGYRDAFDLPRQGLDGLIVTGMEPKMRDLRDEPYWP